MAVAAAAAMEDGIVLTSSRRCPRRATTTTPPHHAALVTTSRRWRAAHARGRARATRAAPGGSSPPTRRPWAAKVVGGSDCRACEAPSSRGPRRARRCSPSPSPRRRPCRRRSARPRRGSRRARGSAAPVVVLCSPKQRNETINETIDETRRTMRCHIHTYIWRRIVVFMTPPRGHGRWWCHGGSIIMSRRG